MGDMREDFESAIESLDVEEDVSEESQEAEEKTAEEETPVQGAAEASGEESTTSPTDEQPDLEAEEKTEEVETKADEPDTKAPVGWNPEARESWKDLPAPVREHITNREREMAQAMHGTKEARKTHDHISNLAQSFAPILAAEGAATPMAAIESLFQTVAELRMGTPTQKAQKMANLIKHYGIDISALDSTLAGQAPSQENSQFETMLDQRLAPINQVMQQLTSMQQQKQVSTQETANNEVAEFSKTAEFLNDVRVDMADLIDLASKQGRTIPLKEAYDKACAMHPEVSKVIQNRTAANDLAAAGNNVASKRQAASSINGRQAGVSTNSKDLSIHDEISSIWDSYS